MKYSKNEIAETLLSQKNKIRLVRKKQKYSGIQNLEKVISSV